MDREIQAGRAVIVIADCGVTMIRCKDRLTMPADVVQVQNMFSCGYGAFSVHDACCICNSGDGDLKTCSCCMLTFHPSCSRSTAARIMSSGAAVPPKPAEALPPSWALCALCALHVGHQSVMIKRVIVVCHVELLFLVSVWGVHSNTLRQSRTLLYVPLQTLSKILAHVLHHVFSSHNISVRSSHACLCHTFSVVATYRYD